MTEPHGIPECTCPHCGTDLNYIRSQTGDPAGPELVEGEERKPKPGERVMCNKCSKVSVLAPDMTLIIIKDHKWTSSN